MRNFCFQRVIAVCSWQDHSPCPVWGCDMAWIGKTSSPHWNYSLWTWKLNHSIWRIHAQIWTCCLPRVQCIQETFHQSRLRVPGKRQERQLNQLVSHWQAHQTQPSVMIQSNGSSILNTYKYHALGDYVQAIWLHGTVDGYNTQLVIFCSRFH